jgi:small basic protein
MNSWLQNVLATVFLVGMAAGLVLASIIFRIGFRLGVEANLTQHAAKLAEEARLHAEIEVSRKRLAESQKRLNRFFTAVLDEEETAVSK